MDLNLLQSLAIDPAISLLTDRMSSRTGKVMLIAIALQESRAKYRAQIGGPARGYWQFERGGGTYGVLKHHASAAHAKRVCETLDIKAETYAVYDAIEYNDVLAAALARLLLWTLPQPLPATREEGWAQYIEAWRPGKPHPSTWPEAWDKAEQAVPR